MDASLDSTRDFYQSTFNASALQHALAAAVRLGVAEAIPLNTPEPMPCVALAQKLDVPPARLYRLLRALAANGVLKEHDHQGFSHTGRSEVLHKDHPHSQRSLLLLGAAPESQAAWAALAPAIAANEGPFANAHGQPLFGYLAEHRSLAEPFNRAMVHITLSLTDRLLQAYPQIVASPSVCDVGGGLGQLVAALLQAAPNMRGGIFDLPELEKPSLDYFATLQLQKRITFAAGSFLKTIPAGYDTYIIKNCLWNWQDHDVAQILKNVVAAKPRKFIIIEPLIAPEKAASSLMDLQMMVMPDGEARSRQKYAALLQGAGMQITDIVHLGGNDWLLECDRV